MGYVLKEGDIVHSKLHTYTAVKELNKGGFSDSYKAVDENGNNVFLKQVKSPTKMVPWFKQYVDYEEELNARLRKDTILQNASIYATDLFLGKACKPDGTPWTKNECFFQVFPFVEGNINFNDMIKKGFGEFDWEKRLYASTVFAFALRKLHEVNIVHCDLKPDNVQVQYDESITMKYRPLLIDMDWSILSDRRAPWHGEQGYVGTPGYNSPEHLKGEIPGKYSDTFTAAIIFCQILADHHPFDSHLSEDDLKEYVLSGKNDFTGGEIPFKEKVTAKFRALISQALSVDPKKRPTMEAIHLELMEMCKDLSRPVSGPHPSRRSATSSTSRSTSTAGTGSGKTTSGHAEPPKTETEKTPSKEPETPPEEKRAKLVLTGDVGSFSTSAQFHMDQKTLKRVSSQAKFADPTNQFSVQVEDGKWSIIGNDSVPNPSTLNGVELGSSTQPLKDGDVIALKGRNSGKTAMEIKVQIVME